MPGSMLDFAGRCSDKEVAVPVSDERAFREAILEGSTVREIADRHDVAPTNVHRAIQRGAREFVDRIHLELLTSHGSGELPAILLPDQPGPTLDRALDLTKWLTNELEARGVQIRVHYRTAHSGLVIAFSDRNPPPNSKVNAAALERKEA
jgi:hypothetical protein